MNWIKNYFVLMFVGYVVLVVGKFFFGVYSFNDISFSYLTYAIFWGYKFDLAASAIVAFLATLFDFRKKIMLLVSVVLLVAFFMLQIGDTMYFADAHRHVSYEVNDILKDFYSLLSTALTQYLTLFLAGGVSVILLSFLLYKIFSSQLEIVRVDKLYIIKKLILIALSVFFVRGMAQHVPLNPWQSNQIGDPKQALISLNSVYNVIYATLRSKGNIQKTKSYVTVDENSSIKSLYKNETKPYKKMLNSPNIVIFYLESWSGMYLKKYGGKFDITPNFDKIYEKSIRPKGMIANGHRTTEGLFASLTSSQNPLGRSIAKTSLQSYKYNTLVKMLQRYGYASAFFQGTDKETSGTGSLAQSLGFEHSYGKRDVKVKAYEENHWGVQDPDLYNFAYEKIENMKKPFIIGINGATTHDTVMPKGVKKLHFVDDEALNDKLNTFHFSDEAMYEFVKKVERKYPNTMFVLMADHCGGGIEGSFSNYLIPFAIYSQKLQPQKIDTFVSQRDMAPTILDIAVGDYRKIAPAYSGKSMLRDGEFFGDFYSNGILGIVKDDVDIELQGDKMKCYDVSAFKPHFMKCPSNAPKLANELKSFTNVQQNLLFSGKTKEFEKYRLGN